jgi:hypothetical protein
VKENMSNGDEFEDYEIGYGRPPKSGQLKKGTSGNPSGRPKKPLDFLSALLREANSEVPITEKGKRKVVKMIEIVAKQVMTKAATGEIQAQRLLYKLLQQAQKRAAEGQNFPNKRDYGTMSAEDLTDGELEWLIKNNPEYAALKDSPEYAALRDIDGRKADARSGSQK